MLDIKLVREKPDFVRQRLGTRGAGDAARVDELLRLDEQRRKWLSEVESLKAQRNRVSKEIGVLMGQVGKLKAAGDPPPTAPDAVRADLILRIVEAKKSETRAIGERIAELDKRAGEAETERDQLILRVPNLPHESVAVGASA